MPGVAATRLTAPTHGTTRDGPFAPRSASTSNGLSPSRTVAGPYAMDRRIPISAAARDMPIARKAGTTTGTSSTLGGLRALWEPLFVPARARRNRRLRLRAMRSLVGFHDGRRFAWVRWHELALRAYTIRISLARLQVVSQFQALHRWLAAARRRACLEHLALAWHARSCVIALHIWRTLCRPTALVNAQRVSSWLRQPRVLRYGWCSWHAYTATARLRREQLAWATRRLAMPRELRGFLVWRQAALATGRWRRLETRMGDAYHRSGARRAWVRWRADCTLRQQARARATFTIDALRDVARRRAWRRWAGAAADSSHVYATVAQSMSIVRRHRSLRGAWRRWEMVADQGRTSFAVSRTLGLYLAHWLDEVRPRRAVKGAWARWAWKPRERGRLQDLSLSVKSLRSARALVRLHARARVRSTMVRALTHLRRRRTWRGLSSWRDALARRAYALSAVRVCVEQWLQHRAYVYLRRWRRVAVARRQLHIGIASMRDLPARRALNAWMGLARMRAAQLGRLLAAVRVLRSGPRVRATFRAWADTDELQRARAQQDSLGSAAPSSPHRRAAPTAASSAAPAVSALPAVSAATSLFDAFASALGDWVSPRGAQGLGGGVDTSGGDTGKRIVGSQARMRYAVAHLTHARLARGWHQWSEATAAATARIRLQYRRLQRSLRRMRVNGAWARWLRGFMAVRRREWIRVRVFRFRHHWHASRALDTWSGYAATRQRVRNRMERAVRRMAPRTRMLSRALHSWLAWLSALDHTRRVVASTRVLSRRSKQPSAQPPYSVVSAADPISTRTMRLRDAFASWHSSSTADLLLGTSVDAVHTMCYARRLRVGFVAMHIAARRSAIVRLATQQWIWASIWRGWRSWALWRRACRHRRRVCNRGVVAAHRRALIHGFSALIACRDGRVRRAESRASSSRTAEAVELRLQRAAAALVGGVRVAPTTPAIRAHRPRAHVALLRRVLREWARHTVDWCAHLRRHAEAAKGSLSGVSFLLAEGDRAAWPRVWKQHAGWAHEVMTWREATAWVGELGIAVPNLSTSGRPDGMHWGLSSANSPAATRLLTALRQGHVYRQLLELVELVDPQSLGKAAKNDAAACHELSPAPLPSKVALGTGRVDRTPPRTTAQRRGTLEAPYATPGSQPRVRAQQSAATPKAQWRVGNGRVLQGERIWWQDTSWRERLNEFLTSGVALEALGSAACRSLAIGSGGGKAVEHLGALSALRVVIEMHDSDRWSAFVEALCLKHADTPQRVGLPRFTAPHPGDDKAACPPEALPGFVCLGCPTPRILLQDERCGQCELQARTSIEEYMSEVGALAAPTSPVAPMPPTLDVESSADSETSDDLSTGDAKWLSLADAEPPEPATRTIARAVPWLQHAPITPRGSTLAHVESPYVQMSFAAPSPWIGSPSAMPSPSVIASSATATSAANIGQSPPTSSTSPPTGAPVTGGRGHAIDVSEHTVVPQAQPNAHRQAEEPNNCSLQ